MIGCSSLVRVRVASRYGRSTVSGNVLESSKGIDKYKIPGLVIRAGQYQTNAYTGKDAQFPFGADILPSPVKKTWAAVVPDPPGRKDGGNITNAVSTVVTVGCEKPSGGVPTPSWDTKSKGLSIMATHRATALVTPALFGSGDSMEDISKSKFIASSRPLSEMEWQRDADELAEVEDILRLRT